MAKTPQMITSKWSKNLGAAGESIKAGINAVTEAPGIKAAARQDSYVAGVMDNADKWGRNVASVTLDQWKRAALDVGLQRIASGITKGTPKMQRFMEQWMPYMEGLQSRLSSNPKGGIEASIARAAEAIRYNKAFRKQ